MQIKGSEKSTSQLILEIGKCLLGSPYIVDSNEILPERSFSMRLIGFDCFTFVESVVALVLLTRLKKYSFKSFHKILQKIRYRSGEKKSYTSRLHYFLDWVYENQKKGIIKDLTKNIGGRPFKKTINFMTRNIEAYPPLKDLRIIKKIAMIEKRLTHRTFYFISKKLYNFLNFK